MQFLSVLGVCQKHMDQAVMQQDVPVTERANVQFLPSEGDEGEEGN